MRRPSRHLLVTVIALVLALLVGVLASRPAGAASSSTVVTATVPSATEVNAAACAPGDPGVTDLGVVLPGASAVTTLDCDVTFGSSNDSSQLRLSQSDAGRRAMFGPSTGTYENSFGSSGVKDLNVAPTPEYYDLLPYPGGDIIYIGEADAGLGWEFQFTRVTQTGGDVWSVNHPIPASLDSMPFDVAIDPAGRIVAAGHSQPSGLDGVVMRVMPNGSLDTTFNASGTPGWRVVAGGGGNQQFMAVDHQSDGKILTGGFDSADGDAKLYRLHEDGSLDTTFGTSGFLEIDGTNATVIDDIEVLADDSIIIAGHMYRGTLYDAFIVKATAGGVVDNTWGGGLQWIDTDDPIADDYDLFLQLDHDPFNEVTWIVSSYDGGATTDTLVARFTANGTPDPGFGSSGVLTYDAVTGQDESGDGIVAAIDGTAYVSSQRVSNGRVYMRHITATGAQDMAFAGDGDWDSGSGWTNYQYRSHLEMDYDGRVIGIAHRHAWRLDSLVVPDYAGGTADWSSAGGGFGACLRAVGGGAGTDGTTWPVDAGNDCAATNADAWRPIVATSATAGSKVAFRATPGVASVSLRFGFRVPDAAAAGRYVAPITFDVLAPNAP